MCLTRMICLTRMRGTESNLRRSSPGLSPKEPFFEIGMPFHSQRHTVLEFQNARSNPDHWPYGLPPIMGGSGEHENTSEEARRLFERLFSKPPSEWKKENAEEYQRIVNEAFAVQWRYPELFDQIAASSGFFDIEHWHRQRKQFEEALAKDLEKPSASSKRTERSRSRKRPRSIR